MSGRGMRGRTSGRATRRRRSTGGDACSARASRAMAEQITLQECSTRLYDRAKRWWAATNSLRAGVVIAGVAATLVGWAPLPASLVAGALALAAWCTQYWTDTARDKANDLRRQMDLQ